MISLVRNKENEEEEVSNTYVTHHKNKGSLKKTKGSRRRIDISKIKSYNCHKTGH